MSDWLSNAEGPIFCVQKHEARHLHYDFRLQVGEVLRSWSVPRGPSYHPGDRRLAIPTEDHPMEYATFEGVIEEGEYGAGTVMLWDIGFYSNLLENPVEVALEEGHLKVFLRGKKMIGGWALVRFRKSEDLWLLIKEKDDYADSRYDLIGELPNSVLTDRSMAKIRSALKTGNP
ncbi:MAG: DNA ligase [Theionarchaea archaeon]|nr:DNA ligase [Theionarchaea archaeon]